MSWFLWVFSSPPHTDFHIIRTDSNISLFSREKKLCSLRSGVKLRAYAHNGLYTHVKEAGWKALEQKCFLKSEVKSLHKLELISVQLCKCMLKANRKEHVCVRSWHRRHFQLPGVCVWASALGLIWTRRRTIFLTHVCLLVIWTNTLCWCILWCLLYYVFILIFILFYSSYVACGY